MKRVKCCLLKTDTPYSKTIYNLSNIDDANAIPFLFYNSQSPTNKPCPTLVYLSPQQTYKRPYHLPVDSDEDFQGTPEGAEMSLNSSYLKYKNCNPQSLLEIAKNDIYGQKALIFQMSKIVIELNWAILWIPCPYNNQDNWVGEYNKDSKFYTRRFAPQDFHYINNIPIWLSDFNKYFNTISQTGQINQIPPAADFQKIILQGYSAGGHGISNIVEGYFNEKHNCAKITKDNPYQLDNWKDINLKGLIFGSSGSYASYALPSQLFALFNKNSDISANELVNQTNHFNRSWSIPSNEGPNLLVIKRERLKRWQCCQRNNKSCQIKWKSKTSDEFSFCNYSCPRGITERFFYQNKNQYKNHPPAFLIQALNDKIAAIGVGHTYFNSLSKINTQQNNDIIGACVFTSQEKTGLTKKARSKSILVNNKIIKNPSHIAMYFPAVTSLVKWLNKLTN